MSEGIVAKLDDARIVYFVGGTDTGKTTLIGELARTLSVRKPVALLDLDVGQSHIGPPTTLGLSVLEEPFTTWEDAPTTRLYFVGSTSPDRHLLQTVAGARLLLDECAGRTVLVDSPGYVLGGPAEALQAHLIELLRPDCVVAIATSDELAPILRRFERLATPRIVRLKPSDKIVKKTPEQRAQYRRQCYARYFRGSRLVRIGLDTVVLIPGCTEIAKSLVGLRTETGRDEAVGIVEASDPAVRQLLVRTPLPGGISVRVILGGSIRLDEEYGEIW